MRIEVIVLPFREFRVICVSYLSGLIAMNTLKTSIPRSCNGGLVLHSKFTWQCMDKIKSTRAGA